MKRFKGLETEIENLSSNVYASETREAGIPDDFIEFNKWLGLPIHQLLNREIGIPKFQQDYYTAVKKHKHFAVNKTTGAGITEITLRMMLHATAHWPLTGNQLAILNGTNMKEASVILARLKDVIINRQAWMIERSSNEILKLRNGRYFKIYPADHIDAIRSQPDLAFVFVDEAAFFEMKVERHINIRNAIERYIPKTDPWILWVSTPNGPWGVFYEIFNEAATRSGPYDYDYMVIPYTTARELLSDQHIERMKKERSQTFEQEFNCKFLAPVNAAIPLDQIECITEEYEI